MLKRSGSTNAVWLFAWFIVTLAPVIAFSPMVRQHDRYLYLPLYPFCAMLAFLLRRLGAGGCSRRRVRVAWAAGIVLAVLWSASVWHELPYWDNERALWQRAVQIAPLYVMGRLKLALWYLDNNEAGAALRLMDDGLNKLPQSANLWWMKGETLYQMKEEGPAKDAFLKAVDLAGENPGREVREAKFASAARLGSLDIASKNYTLAEKWLRLSVAMAPENPQYHAGLAAALRGQGRGKEAAAEEAVVRGIQSTWLEQGRARLRLGSLNSAR